MMKYLLLAIVALVVAVLLGHLLQQDPGFIIIGYGGKFFRMSFVPFAVLGIVATLLAYVLLKFFFQLFSVGKRWNRWATSRRQQLSHKSLSDGLLALAAGDYVRAENLLSKSAKRDSAPTMQWIAAAEAAHKQHAPDRRDRYLAKAREASPGSEAAIGIKRALMQLENGQLEQARATVEYLTDRYPDNQQILLLRRDVYIADNDWQALTTLLPVIRRHRALEPAALAQLEVDTGLALLATQFDNVDELNAAWHKLPKHAREQAQCIAAYATGLVSFGENETAESAIRKALARTWHRDLVTAYRRVRIPNSDLQLERAEAWLAERPDDPDLLVTLAKLAAVAGRWAESRSYLERLTKSQATPEAYQLLADVLEQQGDAAEANRCRRDGLSMVLGQEPLSRINLPAVIDRSREASDAA